MMTPGLSQDVSGGTKLHPDPAPLVREAQAHVRGHQPGGSQLAEAGA